MSFGIVLENWFSDPEKHSARRGGVAGTIGRRRPTARRSTEMLRFRQSAPL